MSDFNQTKFMEDMAKVCKLPDPSQVQPTSPSFSPLKVYIISISSASVFVQFKLLVNPLEPQSTTSIAALEKAITTAAQDGSLFTTFGATGLTLGADTVTISASTTALAPLPHSSSVNSISWMGYCNHRRKLAHSVFRWPFLRHARSRPQTAHCQEKGPCPVRRNADGLRRQTSRRVNLIFDLAVINHVLR